MTGVQTCVFFFQAEDGIRDVAVTGVQTCALPISSSFPASINEWYRSTSGPDTNFKFPRLTVKFNVDPLFADSKIVNPLTAELKTVPFAASVRSEERRVGKECRYRWSPYN